mmetsp:Transcript_28147/g.42583  ORF Transcript_28147/g.42583 Transcript_28147/m.42583 type:complete len:97 (+) Transcript_28147:76-366(+)
MQTPGIDKANSILDFAQTNIFAPVDAERPKILKKWQFYAEVIRREVMRKSFNFRLSNLSAVQKDEYRDILNDTFLEKKNFDLRRKRLMKELGAKKT